VPWPLFEIGLALFLLGGGLFPVRVSSRRSSFHLRNSTALAAFLVLGPGCLRLVLPAALVTVLLLFVAGSTRPGSRLRRLVLPPGSDAASASGRLIRDTLFVVVGMAAAAWVYGLVGSGVFPLPLARVRDLLALVAAITTSAMAVAVQSEVYYRLFSEPVPEVSAVPKELSFLPSDAPLYRLMLVLGSPLQLLAHFFYVLYGPPALLVALVWFSIGTVLHAALLKERLRLQQAFRELEASQRALAVRELTGRIVHQTRHQLGLIGISTHLIRGTLEGPLERTRILAQLDRLDGVAMALRRMLSEELGAQRAEQPAEPVERADGDGRAIAVRDLVHEETERLQGKAHQLGIALRVEADVPGLVAATPADEEQLGQGVFNVVDNALVAARSVVSVRLVRAQDAIVLTIADDGPGIPPEILPRAAEPFVTTKEDGSGMGLFIAAAAARRCGGSLSLENLPDRGLRATLRLPAAPGEPPGRPESADAGS
jgi:signal transduction histidine kinase